MVEGGQNNGPIRRGMTSHSTNEIWGSIVCWGIIPYCKIICAEDLNFGSSGCLLKLLHVLIINFLVNFSYSFAIFFHLASTRKLWWITIFCLLAPTKRLCSSTTCCLFAPKQLTQSFPKVFVLTILLFTHIDWLFYTIFLSFIVLYYF